MHTWQMYKLEFRWSGGWAVSAWYPTLDAATGAALRCFAAYEYRITRGGRQVKRGFLDAHRVEAHRAARRLDK